MKIIAISGDGIGAGKSTLASTLAPGSVFSLAANMRAELAKDYPQYDWFNKSQEYKESTRVTELGNRTVREVLIWYGQDKCEKIHPAYWAIRLGTQLAGNDGDPCFRATCVAIDDIRKTLELDILRIMFPGQVTHIHISYPGAKPEPQYENEALAKIADYTIVRPAAKKVMYAVRHKEFKDIIGQSRFETRDDAHLHWCRDYQCNRDFEVVEVESEETPVPQF